MTIGSSVAVKRAFTSPLLLLIVGNAGACGHKVDVTATLSRLPVCSRCDRYIKRFPLVSVLFSTSTFRSSPTHLNATSIYQHKHPESNTLIKMSDTEQKTPNKAGASGAAWSDAEKVSMPILYQRSQLTLKRSPTSSCFARLRARPKPRSL
jgi:hypothetical protein